MRFVSGIFLLILGASAPSFAFEGTIQWRTVNGTLAQLGDFNPDLPEAAFAVPADKMAAAAGAKTMEFSLKVKGSKMKEVSTDPKANYVVVDGASGKIWMVTPVQQKYMEWTQADRDMLEKRYKDAEKKQQEQIDKLTGEERTKAQKQFDEQRAKMTAPPEVQDLHKQEKIGSFDTEVFDIRFPNRVIRAWVAKQPADLATAFHQVYVARDKMQTGMAVQRDPKSVAAEHGIPVRLVTIQGNTFRLEEIASINEGSVSEQDVALPADYTKITLQDYLKNTLQARLQGAMSGGATVGGAGGATSATPAANPPPTK